MSKTLTVTFDGSVLKPDTQFDLEPSKRYIVTIVPEESTSSQAGNVGNAWDVLESLAGTVEAPDDWASQHNHYLYGTPKYNPDVQSLYPSN